MTQGHAPNPAAPRRGFGTWIAVLAIAAALYYAGSPYLFLYQLRGAIEARDAGQLRDLIDFPAVRESVKDAVNSMMGQAIQSNQAQANPFAALGTLFVGAIAGPMIDAMVTPQGIIAMLSTGVVRPSGDPQTTLQTASDVNSSMSYTSVDRFVYSVWSKASDRPERGISFTFCRSGFSWKMCGINLPSYRPDRSTSTTNTSVQLPIATSQPNTYGGTIDSGATNVPAILGSSPFASESLAVVLGGTAQVRLGRYSCASDGSQSVAFLFKSDGTGGCARWSERSAGQVADGTWLLLVPTANNAGENMFSLIYAETSHGREFLGIMPGDGSGAVAVSIEDGYIVERYHSVVRRSSYSNGRVSTISTE